MKGEIIAPGEMTRLNRGDVTHSAYKFHVLTVTRQRPCTAADNAQEQCAVEIVSSRHDDGTHLLFRDARSSS